MNTHEMIVPVPIQDPQTIKIPFNYVLMEHFPNANNTTTSGIIIPQESKIEADNINRIGIAVRVCKSLRCYYRAPKNATPHQKQREIESVRWKTGIEVQEGDEIWINFQESANAYQFTYEDRYFKLIHYQDIIMAKRGDEVTMCNGYVLLEEMYEEKTSELDFGAPEPIMGKGIVTYFGEPNQEYNVKENFKHADKYRSDDVVTELKKGDVAVILKEYWNKVRYFEDSTQQRFDVGKKYIIVQRYMIGMLM